MLDNPWNSWIRPSFFWGVGLADRGSQPFKCPCEQWKGAPGCLAYIGDIYYPVVLRIPTVDGWNPAPPETYETLKKTGINYQTQLVFTPDFWTTTSIQCIKQRLFQLHYKIYPHYPYQMIVLRIPITLTETHPKRKRESIPTIHFSGANC